MVEYEQGSTITLYVTFVTQTGAAATISGTPQVTIEHFVDGSTGKTTDLAYTNLTLLSGTMSTYYYDYNIPASADKTTYTATYSGVYSDNVNVIGSEDFLVIPRKFYSQRGGGLVTKVSKDTVWSKFEKERVLKLLKQLLQKKPEISNIKDLITKTFGSVEDLSSSLGVYQSNVQKEYDSLVKELNVIRELSGKEIPKFDDSKIIEKLDTLSRELSKLDTQLKTERTAHIIAGVDDLKKEIEDFKKSYVLSLSNEQIERLKRNANR